VRCSAKIVNKIGKRYLIIAEKELFRVGEFVTINNRDVRTEPQNKIYWTFLNWCITTELHKHGYCWAPALHENLKHQLGCKTTTDLSKKEFSDWIDKVNHFMLDFFGFDSSVFWEVNEQTREA
jgi:hypothetical protein